MPNDVAPGEFKVSDLDDWSAPLGQLAWQALTADLIALLPQGRVIFPHLANPEGAIGVDVDLLVFSANREGVNLEVSWVITSAGPRSESYGGTAVLRTDQPGTGAAATAQAISTLLAQLADRIVADLLSLVVQYDRTY